MKRLYISDLDGTLLNSNARLTDNTAEIINELSGSGLAFTFATARTAASAVQITQKMTLSLPCILMNGVSIYDINAKKYIKNEYIKRSAALAVEEIFLKNNLQPYMYKIENEELYAVYTGFSNNEMFEFYKIRKDRYDKPFIKCNKLNEQTENSTVYFTILDSHDRLLPVKNEIEKISDVKFEFYKDVYHENLWFLEIFSCNASKFNAACFLKEYGGFDHITGFGDNFNDLPLFNACDRKIAVGNARDKIKETADIVIGNNDSDAVALWLKENFLNERI